MESAENYVEEYRPLVRSIAHRVRNRYDLRMDLEDLIAFGMEGLVDAKNRFDPERGVKFPTYARYRIQGSIIDGVRRSGPLSRHAYHKLKAAQAALYHSESLGEAKAAQQHQASPEETLAELRDTVSKLTASYIMASVGQEEFVEETPEDALITEEARERIRDVLHVLPERERALVDGFYFQGRRFDHVAEELGISKSWASRLHSKALKLLRNALVSGPEVSGIPIPRD